MASINSLTSLRLPRLPETAIGGMLRRWRRTLRDCLPPRLRQWLLQRQAPILVVSPKGADALLSRQIDSERVVLAELQPQVEAPIATLVPKPRNGWRETRIELPAEQIMSRQVSLPAQVKDKLRQVVGYELDRLTPFRAQDVYYAVSSDSSGARGSRLDVKLAICRRDQADPWLERLRRLGSPAACLSWEGAWEGANLLPDDQRSRKRNLGWLLSSALFMLIAGLITALMLSAVMQKEQELTALERVLRGVRIEAEQVPVLREELERARAGSLAVLERKAAQPRMIDLLRELTDRLPDHTWVQTVNVREQEVDIRGESDQATELLNLLGEAPGITEVSFRSPVMQVSQTGKERFHVAFRYRRPAL
jgi:general secretion pathway protein L